MMGSGPAAKAIVDLARRLGIAGRIQLRPFVRDPVRLARAHAAARAVVMPGAHETFGRRFGWDEALGAELADLRRLVAR